LNLIDLSLKNVLLRARSWWTGRKRRRPEDEGAPVVHVFQGEGRRRLKRTEDRHRWLYFSCPAHHPFCNWIVLFCSAGGRPWWPSSEGSLDRYRNSSLSL